MSQKSDASAWDFCSLYPVENTQMRLAVFGAANILSSAWMLMTVHRPAQTHGPLTMSCIGCSLGSIRYTRSCGQERAPALGQWPLGVFAVACEIRHEGGLLAGLPVGVQRHAALGVGFAAGLETIAGATIMILTCQFLRRDAANQGQGA